MPATRADVARAAGVSPSTVSYVLSGKRPTSDQTRRRVLQKIEELGYSPNHLASGLASPAIRTIGVLFRLHRLTIDTTDLSYVAGVRAGAQEHGARVVLPVVGGEAPLENLRHLLRSRSIDAAVLMDVAADDDRESVLVQEQIPTVLIGTSGRGHGMPSIDADFAQETRVCLKHLQALGHQRVLAALREAPPGTPRVYQEHIQQVWKAAEQLGLELVLRESAENVLAGAALVTEQGLAEGCTAFISNNAKAMNGIVCAAYARGFHLPRDFSGVSLGLSAEAGPGEELLSEYSVNRREMGYRAVKMLLESEVGTGSIRVLAEAEFFDRGSTGAAPK